MKIFTIGFTHKRAQDFFNLIKSNGIQCLVDIRLNPSGQLSGFAKQEDLPYFLDHLANGCKYTYIPLLAPTKQILEKYRTDGDWSQYVIHFESLMNERNIPDNLNQDEFEKTTSCLLCSESTPEKCHRRLVAERIQIKWSGVEIVHL